MAVLVLGGLLLGAGAWWGIDWLVTGSSGFGPQDTIETTITRTEGQPATIITKTSSGHTQPLEVLKVALTIVAGIGGVVALTVAYRKQRDNESTRFDTQFADAARQLGGQSAAIRIAGVYAMAALADRSSGHWRQQCISALCAYLRLPYHAGEGDGLLATSTQRRSVLDPAGTTHETERTYRLQPQEREVRLAIIKVIRDHLQVGARILWDGHQFDFTGATFDGGNFTNVAIRDADTRLDFSGATFDGGTVDFTGATFDGGAVDFTGAKFLSSNMIFNSATFSGATVNFGVATITGSRFYLTDAAFSGGTVSFSGVLFAGGSVAFTRTTFDGCTVDFAGAMCAGAAVIFSGAKFLSGTVDFAGAMFLNGTVAFPHSEFVGGTVNFAGAEFVGGTVKLEEPAVWTTPPVFDIPPPDGLLLPDCRQP